MQRKKAKARVPKPAHQKSGAPKDEILSPEHYTFAEIEPLDCMEVWGWAEDFYRGSILKYLVRAGRKPGSSKLTDYRKAAEYARRLCLIAEKKAPSEAEEEP